MKFEARHAVATRLLILAAVAEVVLWKQGYALKAMSIVAALTLAVTTVLVCGRCRRGRCGGDYGASTWFGGF
jgi:hypothetical protein